MDFGIIIKPEILVAQPLWPFVGQPFLAVFLRPQLHILGANQSRTHSHRMGEH